jgi:hypothetical protein
MVEASSSGGGRVVVKRELGRGSSVVASGACQGSEWILVVQSWLLAGIQ